jgi:hypothetical protein
MTLIVSRHKYGAKPTFVDGHRFDSKAEAKRYSELKLLEKQKRIHALELQPRYDFVINGVKIGFYKADFRYRDTNGQTIVEDVKGYRTDVYAIKAKLMRALYGIEVQEIGRGR